MVRGLLSKIASRALSHGGKGQHQQLRRLNIHEYQVALTGFVDFSVFPFFFLCFSKKNFRIFLGVLGLFSVFFMYTLSTFTMR